MSVNRPAKKAKKNIHDESLAGFRLDFIFSGPLLFVPEIQDENIVGVEVYSPSNGHPVGAVFLPKVFFSDQELDDPKSDNWPESGSFSLLDPHSYLLRLTQTGKATSFSPSLIPDTNHKVKGGRKMSGYWEIAFKLTGQLSRWSTHRLSPVTGGMYYGSDSPAGPTVASVQRLSYAHVTDGDFCGLGPEQTAYLSANLKHGGTLIVEGETPYQSTLLHERQAIDALAKLAGLNLHLTSTAPIAGRSRLQGKVAPCLNSVIVL